MERFDWLAAAPHKTEKRLNEKSTLELIKTVTLGNMIVFLCIVPDLQCSFKRFNNHIIIARHFFSVSTFKEFNASHIFCGFFFSYRNISRDSMSVFGVRAHTQYTHIFLKKKTKKNGEKPENNEPLG